jgi:DNA-binding XRE family transcriptional regulator
MFLIAGSLDESNSPMAQSNAIWESVRWSDIPLLPVPPAGTIRSMAAAGNSPEQLKATRDLLGWSQVDVANRVGLSEWVIGFFERGERLIRARYLRQVRSILASAGVEFIAESGGGAGVRLRKAAK